MRYARIDNDVAVEIVDLPDDLVVAQCYHPSLTFVPAGTAEIGWVYDDGEFSAPPPPPLPTKATLVAYAANKRWQVETGGIEVGGAQIDTSRDSQSMITGAYTWSQANPSEIVKFKAASGWVDLDAATLAAIATAVGAHVQACFAVEASVAAEIEAGTITTTAEIEAANWPA